MPHEQMNEKQLADYLHLNVREIAKLAARGKIPCRKTGGSFLFRKGEIDHWVEQQMHEMGVDRLAGIERGVSRHHGFDYENLLVSPLIPDKGLAVPLGAKTRESAIRAMVNLADKAGLVYDRDDLMGEIRAREELCTTAIIPGVALPHPRHPLPYDIAESFVVVGLTPSGIPYASTDGSLTRLFFLICCKDERTHLHVLARVARMLSDGPTRQQIMEVETPDELLSILVQREKAVAGQGD